MSLKDKTINKIISHLKFVIFGIGLVITLSLPAAIIGMTTPTFASASAISGAGGATNNHNIQVQVGGGNETYPFFGYNPQKIEIDVGDSVTWTGTSQMEEPYKRKAIAKSAC